MKPRKRFTNLITTSDRGVAPVVGVGMLLGIIVIIAAGVSVLAFGIGDTADAAPSTGLEVEHNQDQDVVEIRHTGGETLRPGDTSHMSVTGSDNLNVAWNENVLDPDSPTANTEAKPVNEITSGVLLVSVSNIDPGDTIRVNVIMVGGTSYTIAESSPTPGAGQPITGDPQAPSGGSIGVEGPIDVTV